MSSDADQQQRTLKIDLVVTGDDDAQRLAVLNQVRQSIRQYRAVLRHCFSVLTCAQAAAAEISWQGGDAGEIRVRPNNDAARQVLAAATGKDGAALGYQLREYVLQTLAPTWHSFVWDSLRRDMSTAWTAKDAEFPRAGRGWLILQGARGISRFNNRGIGFPV